MQRGRVRSLSPAIQSFESICSPEIIKPGPPITGSVAHIPTFYLASATAKMCECANVPH